MEFELDLDSIRKTKTMVGVPLYGGQSAGQFTKSMMDLVVFFTKYGLNIQPFFIFNESLITRARNYIADEFLRSDCSHLLFIDGDIDFSPEDVLFLLHYSLKGDLDVTCGPYPKKHISWEKIKAAVDQGKADQDPNVLEKYVGDFVLGVEKEGSHNLYAPIEVSESGTGFMLIQRKVLEKFADTYPELKYYPDHVRMEHFAGDREITAFFLDVIHEKRHLSEDYMFCHWVKRMGGHIWLLPWLKLNHVGSYTFKGDLIEMVAANQSLTADPSKIKKK